MEDLDNKLGGAGEEDLGDVGVPAQVVHRGRVGRIRHQELDTIGLYNVHRGIVGRIRHQELDTIGLYTRV